MRKVVDYVTITVCEAKTLDKSVKEWLGIGYELYGEPRLARHESLSSVTHSQTMVKYEEISNNNCTTEIRE